MKSIFILITVICLTGCASQRMLYKDQPDIKNDISLAAGVTFDIRILRDIYGKPQILDLNGSALIYSNVYEICDDSLFLALLGFDADYWSEAWYLVLRPAEKDHYYTAERYKYKLKAFEDIDGFTVYPNPDIWESAAAIEKNCTKQGHETK